MIELRADGTIPGAPKIGRVYKMAGEGRLWFASFTAELVSDWPPYIEKYAGFRGFVSDFLDLDALDAKLQECKAAGFSKEEQEVEKVKYLKELFLKSLRDTEKAAADYFAACPVGPERIRASDIFENIRNATRV